MIQALIRELKNNKTNRAFIKKLQKNLNTERFRIRVRARHSDRKAVLKENYCKHSQNDISLKEAQRLAVYIDIAREEKEIYSDYEMNKLRKLLN